MGCSSRKNYDQVLLFLAELCKSLPLTHFPYCTRIREYVDGDHSEKFTDSQFLVFVNRILAFAFSGIYLLVSHQRTHRTPLYKYGYCSVSNTLSSWCQYEALKFVSFPTQVPIVIPLLLIQTQSYPHRFFQLRVFNTF